MIGRPYYNASRSSRRRLTVRRVYLSAGRSNLVTAAAMAKATMEAPADAADEEDLDESKKWPASKPTGIVFEYDLPNNRVILPSESYRKNPKFYMLREQRLIKECLEAAISMFIDSVPSGRLA